MVNPRHSECLGCVLPVDIRLNGRSHPLWWRLHRWWQPATDPVHVEPRILYKHPGVCCRIMSSSRARKPTPETEWRNNMDVRTNRYQKLFEKEQLIAMRLEGMSIVKICLLDKYILFILNKNERLNLHL